MEKIFLPHNFNPAPEFTAVIDETLLVGLVERLQEDLRVGQVKLFCRCNGLLLKSEENASDALPLLLILQVVNA